MMRHLLAICLVGVFTRAAFAADAPAAKELTFERHVRPILKAHCFDCHGANESPEGGLDLRLRRFMVAGGQSGPSIVPGSPEESYLLERIRNGEMPPGEAKVSAEELARLERWVASGAKTARSEPEQLSKGIGITAEEREFWSFQPLRRVAIPRFSPQQRVRTPIDALLLAEMRKQGLSFSPDAGKETLLRRAYFDLIGLPPTSEEVARFLADRAEDAYERLIDRLLSSPHYGERWGRHWLDVAGYADSEGYTNTDAVRNYAYKYRDYVIRCLNRGKPFDQFIVEQLAGDELVPYPYRNLTADQTEKLVATGLLRMAADGTDSGNVDQAVARNQVIADTISIVSSALLGLSVRCAQCHDHRYDPVTQTDYYRLRAVFEPAYDWNHWRSPQQRRISLYTDADRAEAAAVEAEAKKIADEKAEKQARFLAEALEKELAKYEEELRDKLRAAYKTPAAQRTDEQKQLLKEHPSLNIHPGVLYQYNQKAADELKKFDARIAEVRGRKPVEEFVRALTEVPGQVPVTHLFHRGDHRQPKQAVPPGGLTITASMDAPFDIPSNAESLPTTGRRLAYARYLTSGPHPLVTRVLVNRVWMHHFGRGIVETPEDFGTLGARPSHPELLDWLASEFVAQGWDLKKLHKTIMTSTAYRQSSYRDPKREAMDADNRLYWRKPIRRLEAEVIRDRILAVSGMLSPRMFGPPVGIKADDAGQIVVAGEASRRSIYIQVRRSQPVALLKAFDAPVMETNCVRRPASTVASQSLMLMNSDFILQQAERFAQRVAQEAPRQGQAVARQGQGLPEPSAGVWQFGYGRFDENRQRTVFQQLPHWTGSAWQGGPQLPDAKLGWVLLHADGGHPGDAQHAAIRRWIAPAQGLLSVTGKLHHPSEKGDGVRGRLVSDRSGLLGEWIAQHGEVATELADIAVQEGDVLDFLVDCRGDVGYDSFSWPMQLEVQKTGSAQAATWASQAGFRGPLPPRLPQQAAYAWQLAYCRPATPDELRLSLDFLAQQIQHLQDSNHADPWQQAMTSFCQTLLSTNEFLYID